MNTTTPNQVVPQENDEIDLSMIISELWENKWIILLITAIMLSMGVFYASKQIPQYQSTILLQIEPNKQVGAGLVSQQLSLGGNASNSEATQIALIKSGFILEPVIKELGLDISTSLKQSAFVKRFFPSNLKLEVKKFNVADKYLNKSFELVINKNNYLSLYSPEGELLLEGPADLLLTNHDKSIQLFVDSAKLKPNNTFIINKHSTGKIVQNLQSHLSIVDLGTNRQNTGVIEITLSNPDPIKTVTILNAIGRTIQDKDVKKNAMEASKTLDFLYKQLPITKEDLEKSETELNYYRAKNGKIDIKQQSQSLLAQLTEFDKQLINLRVEKIDKLQNYTASHPFIIALNTKLHNIKAERKTLENQLKKLPASDQIAMNLMRDVEVKNNLYTALLNKIQELQVLKAGIVSDVRILLLAKLPNEALPIKKLLIYVASVLLGFLLSFIFIFGRKMIFPRIIDPHWIERQFDIVNLAIVPYSKEQALSVKNALHSNQRILLANTHPHNLAIESLRSLRTTLQVRLTCAPNNIVAILGASPGVGKTFISANWSYLLATAGKRVLLIDADLRRGTLHKYFNVPPAPGLAEILNKKKTIEETLLPTLHENLVILPRGIYPSDPSELLSSNYFKEIITIFSHQFDLVVIDTPPVLLVTDAVLISLMSGTNYLVMGANTHQPSDLEMTVKKFLNAGINLNGTIFNFHKQDSHRRGSYYSKYYKYGYKYYDTISK